MIGAAGPDIGVGRRLKTDHRGGLVVHDRRHAPIHRETGIGADAVAAELAAVRMATTRS